MSCLIRFFKENFCKDTEIGASLPETKYDNLNKSVIHILIHTYSALDVQGKYIYLFIGCKVSHAGIVYSM